MALTVINGPTIAAGESLSDAVDVGGDLVRITMPAAWTDADLTFQISTDGQFFNDLYGYEGNEIDIPVIPGSAILLPPMLMSGINFIKFRSGRSQNPRPQEKQRVFAVTVDRGGPVGILEEPPPA